MNLHLSLGLLLVLAAAVTSGCAAVPVEVKATASLDAEESSWVRGVEPKVAAKVALECTWRPGPAPAGKGAAR